MLHFLLQLSHMTRLCGKVQVPVPNSQSILWASMSSQTFCTPQTELPEPFGGFITDPFFDAGLICPLPRADMPAIAPEAPQPTRSASSNTTS